MQRKAALVPGEYYHVYNRGVEKRDIFLTTGDKDRFVHMLYLANGTKPVVHRLVQGLPLYEVDVGEKRVAIGAYVLMSNHFHILVKEIQPGGITGFMEKLQTSYAMYFNKKYTRVGSLFQGTFKAEHVHRDEHLKHLFAYIHLNPLKRVMQASPEHVRWDIEGMRQFLGDYDHSSYHDYMGQDRTEAAIVSRGEFPPYFDQPQQFADFIDTYLRSNELPHLVQG